jgi:N-acetylglucosamine repressor
MKTSKATRDQLKRHNRQLLLRAVYSGAADTRSALAAISGLAKPTVSDLTAEMIDEGLLMEIGPGESTDSGGKRPTLLRFVPDARQVIGISLDNGRAFGVLSNLAGQISAQHYAELDSIQGEEAVRLLEEVINGLIAQLDAPLLCIGVGVPGVVESAAGLVRHSPPLGWIDLPLADRLALLYQVPVHIGNSAELTALAQFAFGINGEDHTRRLVTILISNSVEVGITLDRVAYHQGGDLSSLCIALPGAMGEAHTAPLDAFIGWKAVQARMAALRQLHPGSNVPETGFTYLDIRHSAAEGDRAARQLCEELAASLAQVFAWVIALLQPDHVSLAGPIVNLGEGFLSEIVTRAGAIISPELTRAVVFSLAYSGNLSAIGGAALALQNELGIL